MCLAGCVWPGWRRAARVEESLVIEVLRKWFCDRRRYLPLVIWIFKKNGSNVKPCPRPQRRGGTGWAPAAPGKWRAPQQRRTQKCEDSPRQPARPPPEGTRGDRPGIWNINKHEQIWTNMNKHEQVWINMNKYQQISKNIKKNLKAGLNYYSYYYSYYYSLKKMIFLHIMYLKNMKKIFHIFWRKYFIYLYEETLRCNMKKIHIYMK
jgi:hypothetical protein